MAGENPSHWFTYMIGTSQALLVAGKERGQSQLFDLSLKLKGGPLWDGVICCTIYFADPGSEIIVYYEN